MTDRLADIRARLVAYGREDSDDSYHGLHDHAPADIAWLLSTLEDASERVAILRAEIADLEARP
jgi:uncharacterized small protein (DUF1192 family)